MRQLHSNKIIMLFVGLFLLVIVGVFLYISLPSNDKPFNAYYGWHTYCSSATQICFKYPRSWKAVKYQPDYQGIATFQSSNNSEQISYEDGGTCTAVIIEGTIYTVSIENLPTNPRVTVVGMILSNVPQYTLINTDQLKLYNLPLHKLINGNTNLCTSFKDSSMGATPNQTFNSLDGAKAWFNSQDAKTALLSLKSVTFR